jgi:hypothetical protein
MGYSNWEAHGKRYKYWQFAESKRAQSANEVEEHSSRIYSAGEAKPLVHIDELKTPDVGEDGVEQVPVTRIITPEGDTGTELDKILGRHSKL